MPHFHLKKFEINFDYTDINNDAPIHNVTWLSHMIKLHNRNMILNDHCKGTLQRNEQWIWLDEIEEWMTMTSGDWMQHQGCGSD